MTNEESLYEDSVLVLDFLGSIDRGNALRGDYPATWNEYKELMSSAERRE